MRDIPCLKRKTRGVDEEGRWAREELEEIEVSETVIFNYLIKINYKMINITLILNVTF